MSALFLSTSTSRSHIKYTLNNKSTACADSNCQNCSSNFRACQAGRSDSKSYLEDGKCRDIKDLYLDSAGFTATRVDTKSYTYAIKLTFRQDLSNLSVNVPLSDYLDMTAIDSFSNNRYSCSELACYLISQKDNVAVIGLRPSSISLRGYIEIMNKSTSGSDKLGYFESVDGSRVFADYPITVKNVVFYVEQQASNRSLGVTALTIINKGQVAVSLVATFSYPRAAGYIDMIMSKLLSLQVLEGPIIELLETILSARGELTFLPFYLTDPFSSFESDDECKSYPGFIDHGYRCNLLANQGVSIAGLFVLLFVCASITGVVVVALKFMKKYEARRLNKPRGLSEISGIPEKRNIEETRLWKILSLVRNRLGLQYWVIKISGMQLELMIFSLLRIRTA